MLAMLLPTILPRAISLYFLTIATILTAASGQDVPKATNMRPIKRVESLRRQASFTEVFMRKSEETASKIRPKISMRRFNSRGIEKSYSDKRRYTAGSE